MYMYVDIFMSVFIFLKKNSLEHVISMMCTVPSLWNQKIIPPGSKTLTFQLLSKSRPAPETATHKLINPLQKKRLHKFPVEGYAN